MEVKGSVRLTVPTGFRNLLEGLTVEILRSNPPDIYKFAADYFRAKLDARQEVGYDDCFLGSQIDGYYRYEPHAAEREEQERAATRIQTTFRGHKVRQESKLRQENHHKRNMSNNAENSVGSAAEGASSFGGNEHAAATCIQAGYHGYGTRDHLRGSSEEQNKAAKTIQSGYRGYVTRRKRAAPTVGSETNEKDDKDQGKEPAAIKISAAYRGHHVKDGTKKREGARTSENERTGAAEGREKNAVKIQANYRGYRTRKYLTSTKEAATTIQACYRGCRERKLRRAKSEAAVVIQRSYRCYRARNNLRKQTFADAFLDISNDHAEFAVHRDSRTSFSLPAGVQFEGSLDDDSDTEIEKIVDRMEAKKRLKAILEVSSPEMTEDKDGRMSK